MSEPSRSFFEYLRLKCLATVIRFGARAQGLSGKPSPDEVLEIASREKGRTIKVHVYRPAKTQKPQPVLINWHGSGFVLPLHGSDSLFCRRIAKETGYTVIDAPYRLAPENPFPAALNDVEDLISSVLNHPEEFDARRIAVSGFSAGGNLALVAASNPHSAIPRGTISTLMAFYPVTNLSVDPGAKRAPDGSPGSLPAFLGRMFNRCYMLPGTDAQDPCISPLFAKPEDFPEKVLIVTCGKDNLAGEAEELAEKVRQVPGKKVLLKRIEGAEHGWDKTNDEKSEDAKTRDEAYQIAIDLLNGINVAAS